MWCARRVTPTHRRGRRALRAGVAAIAMSALVPAAAGAASVQVTGDDGTPIALGGPVAIRTMSPQLTLVASASEHTSLTVTGPTGTKVASDLTCFSGPLSGKSVDFVGNGTYTVVLTTFGDAACKTQTGQQTLPFAIGASVAITSPTAPVLTRKPGSPTTGAIELPIALNPGALTHEIFAGVGVQPGPDGSLPGAVQQVFPGANGTVAVPLDKGPGTYAVVGRAKGFTGLLNAQAFSPWSAPALVRAYAPFDLKALTFPDASGPSYRLRGTINEAAATGRVSLAIARGRKGGRYRSLGAVRIRGHAVTKRFTLRRSGTYRLRFRYKGNALIAPGFEVRTVRITRGG